MKRILCCLLLILFFAGCSGKNEMNRALAFRQVLLSGNCVFDADITADYGDKLYSFSMHCQSTSSGDFSFTVTMPETIAGISGTLSADSGKIIFDDVVLAFPMLVEGRVTPVSAPWLLIRSLRSGFIAACGNDGELFRISLNDSYAEDSIRLDVWLNEQDKPVRGDLLWDGKRFLTVDVKNFDFV